MITRKTEPVVSYKQWMKATIVLKLNDNPDDLIHIQWDRVPSIGECITLPTGDSYKISDIETTFVMQPMGPSCESSVTTLYCTKLTRWIPMTT